jgi:hypothetical protein
MTTMAAFSPRMYWPGPTHLYLNFDGGTVSLDPVHDPSGKNGTHTIDAFDTEKGDATHNRNQDIQEVLFEVSQVFAPFNVQVSRISGAGNYDHSGDGGSTIFIGGDASNVTSSGSKFKASSTPPTSMDYPSPNDPADWPNSHPYDIAFVDPVSGTTANRSTWKTEAGLGGMFDITRSIAHEAGHTFGLAHVRSDGSSDPATLGTGSVDDVMSYDARNQYFANQSLNITDWNREPNDPPKTPGLVNGYKIEPGFRPTNFWLETIRGKTYASDYPVSYQNSYSYLTVELGPRASDGYAHVADLSRVDTTYQDGPRPTLTANSTMTGQLTGKGDYNVYTLNVAPGQDVTIDVQAVFLGWRMPWAWTPSLNPDILVYDSSGRTLLDYSLNTNHAAYGALSGGSGGTFLVVVGSVDGNTNGGYQITVKPSPNWRHIWRDPFGQAPGVTTGQATPQGPLGAIPADPSQAPGRPVSGSGPGKVVSLPVPAGSPARARVAQSQATEGDRSPLV